MSSDGSMWNEVNEKYVGVNDPDMMNMNNWMKGQGSEGTQKQPESLQSFLTTNNLGGFQTIF